MSGASPSSSVVAAVTRVAVAQLADRVRASEKTVNGGDADDAAGSEPLEMHEGGDVASLSSPSPSKATHGLGIYILLCDCVFILL